MSLLTECGLVEVKEIERFDAFKATSKEKVARKFGVEGVNVFGRKPLDECAGSVRRTGTKGAGDCGRMSRIGSLGLANIQRASVSADKRHR